MKVFDEDENYLGEFFEYTKNKVEDSFESSWIWGIICLFLLAPWWTLFGILLYFTFKLMSFSIKFTFKVIWWIIRLPFYLIFRKEFPKF